MNREEAQKQDTIAAIATPLGSGGVGIVRLSGPGALKIGEPLFVSARDGFCGLKPYRLHHGWIKDSRGTSVDEVLLSFMPGPGSYTGEDVLEINCHGGPAVVQRILELCLENGARSAEPGEFTKRAFLNGRLDLTQAEAVLETVNARTSTSLALAQNKLSGAMRERINKLRDSLEGLHQQFSLAVDFPEEDAQCLPPETLKRHLESCMEDIRALIANCEQGSVWKEGAVLALAGRVNAGKSSLLNCILGRERSIVTEVAGTTRDFIEEEINVRGLPLRVVDTAGLRRSEDTVEQAGVQRCRELLQSADLVVLLVDSCIGPHEEDREILEECKGKRILAAANKCDLPQAGELEGLPDGIRDTVRVSAKTGRGVDRLLERARRLLVGGLPEPDSNTLVPNLRQKRSLEQAADELESLLRDLDQGMPYDLLGVRLDYASNFLGEITGEIAPEDVLNSIFDNFCIGK